MSQSDSEATRVFVGRQPISDIHEHIYAYELLFRDSLASHAVITNAERATADVLVNSLMEIGLERMVGSARAFVNVSRDFILGGYCRSLPKSRLVLEILEDTVPDAMLFEELTALRKLGYTFALDDYTFEGDARQFLPYVDCVKVDLRLVDRSTIERELPSLHQQVLAEKVETQEEYEFCRACGFDYFQGYFFCRPSTVSTVGIPVNRASIFSLLAKLHDPEATPQELETTVGEDLSLSYKLLRYINSASMGLSNTIESIGHAVRLIGTEHIRLLASLIMLTTVNDKPQELINVSLIRARMCDLLAAELGHKNRDAYFTVGLFSTLDAFLDRPLEQALEALPLSEPIRQALLFHRGPLGEVLRLALSCEENRRGPDAIQDVYWQSVGWQQDMTAMMAPA